MKRKKSRFWTFCFSFIPGAAEMYMGFMKNGLSIMALFFVSFIIPVVLRVSDVFILLAVLVWFYGFFHARNLAACADAELQELPDEFVWENFESLKNVKISNPTLRKIAAWVLIIYGGVSLWNTFSWLVYRALPEYLMNYVAPVINVVPESVVAIVIIVLGVKLISGKKEEMKDE